jgi:hypothetical protein
MGTQDNSCHFSSRIPVTQNDKNLEVPKGGRGLESASLILMKGLESVQNPSDLLEAGFGRPGFPLHYLTNLKLHFIGLTAPPLRIRIFAFLTVFVSVYEVNETGP